MTIKALKFSIKLLIENGYNPYKLTAIESIELLKTL